MTVERHLQVEHEASQCSLHTSALLRGTCAQEGREVGEAALDGVECDDARVVPRHLDASGRVEEDAGEVVVLLRLCLPRAPSCVRLRVCGCR